MPSELKKKGARYSPEAIDQCLRLYLKYNGEHYERIERDMRRAGYESFRSVLMTGKRRKGKANTPGWISEYNWEKALAIHLANKPTASLNDAEQLVREIKEIRKRLHHRIQVNGAKDEKELQLYRDYANLTISALTRVEAAKDTLGGWVSFWERLTDWAPDIDIRLARLLVRHSDQFIARAEEEFGESQETIAEMNVNPDEDQAEPAVDSRTED